MQNAVCAECRSLSMAASSLPDSVMQSFITSKFSQNLALHCRGQRCIPACSCVSSLPRPFSSLIYEGSSVMSQC